MILRWKVRWQVVRLCGNHCMYVGDILGHVVVGVVELAGLRLCVVDVVNGRRVCELMLSESLRLRRRLHDWTVQEYLPPACPDEAQHIGHPTRTVDENGACTDRGEREDKDRDPEVVLLCGRRRVVVSRLSGHWAASAGEGR